MSPGGQNRVSLDTTHTGSATGDRFSSYLLVGFSLPGLAPGFSLVIAPFVCFCLISADGERGASLGSGLESPI